MNPILEVDFEPRMKPPPKKPQVILKKGSVW